MAASRQDRGKVTRSRILRAALKEFARAGLDGASVKTISERAGVANGTVFWHFENKTRLYLDAVALAAEELYQGLLPVVNKTGASFMQVIDYEIEFRRQNSEVDALLSSLRAEHPRPVVRDAARLVDVRVVAIWHRWIAGLGTGSRCTLPSGNADRVARLIASTVSGLLATRSLDANVDVRTVLADFGALVESQPAPADNARGGGSARQ